MSKPTEKDYLNSAALAVERQAMEGPELGIPVDPDVADFMGAFAEQAIGLDGVLDAGLLNDEE